MLSRRYKKLDIYRFSSGSLGVASGYNKALDIKGLIQAPSNNSTFRNGKETSNVDGILFCSVTDGQKLQARDKVQDVNGTRYIISGAKSQPNGISGLTPKKGQHCEFSLSFDDGA